MADHTDVDTQLQALAAAQAKSTSYIEELDERLALEQATREDQARLISQLQATLTARTAKESDSASRATEAERALGELKQEVCSMRIRVSSSRRCARHTRALNPHGHVHVHVHAHQARALQQRRRPRTLVDPSVAVGMTSLCCRRVRSAWRCGRSI